MQGLQSSCTSAKSMGNVVIVLSFRQNPMRHSSEHGPQQPQDYGVAEPCCVLRAAQDTAGFDALRREYHMMRLESSKGTLDVNRTAPTPCPLMQTLSKPKMYHPPPGPGDDIQTRHNRTPRRMSMCILSACI